MSDLDVKVKYMLFDDGGVCDRWLPILLPIGTVFKHEYGTYKVERYIEPHASKTEPVNEFTVVCERLDSRDGLKEGKIPNFIFVDRP
ncbi:MAG: hypothetical protein BWY47_01917 [Bacteroidetes bacterium ADurb.Bin302]|jgi:hypothetical protein|nr:MAG: hypothetical protein BWY47_01917 [Bacteroidetes bacterium ADurb.Bin302]